LTGERSPAHAERTLLVQQRSGRQDDTESLEELALLAGSAGALVAERVTGTRRSPDPATFVGKGKLEELQSAVAAHGGELVVFDHALRFFNNMIVSQDPLVPDERRFEKVLSSYVIDGEPVFDLLDPDERRRFEEVVDLLDTFTTPPNLAGFETRDDVLARTRGKRIVTDDNMGTEWTHDFDAEPVPEER